ncbi:unnamed protein product [Prorocentrum cordatum]|uniref:Transmembrane protein 147 n=2 Tax=Prorocentrum cordatum TaxID=2364126 RepID=A0ABN9VU34_9DINO|nr:unnamed protein product [Polarella glacialis]
MPCHVQGGPAVMSGAGRAGSAAPAGGLCRGLSLPQRPQRMLGLIASGAAVYNVHTIESTFGHLIEGYSPLLKFLSVKLLVFFAFWQLKVLLVLKTVGILRLPELQIKMLHAALLVFECFGSAVLHVKAWNATEVWYKADSDTEHVKATEEGAHDEKVTNDERRPLLHKRSR